MRYKKIKCLNTSLWKGGTKNTWTIFNLDRPSTIGFRDCEHKAWQAWVCWLALFSSPFFPCLNFTSDLWQQWIGFWSWIWSMRHWTGARSGLLISMLGKLNWFLLTGLITLVLLMWKWMGLFLRKSRLLRCWGWLSLLTWIRALTLTLLLKLPSRKLEP